MILGPQYLLAFLQLDYPLLHALINQVLHLNRDATALEFTDKEDQGDSRKRSYVNVQC